MASPSDIMKLLEKLQSININVHQSRCIEVRNRNAHCMRCAEVCTSGCISYFDNELSIDPGKCIGCGTCATACPTCALEAQNPSDKELMHKCVLAARAADGEVIIACNELLEAAEGLYDVEKVVGVKCLGRVEESLLVTLADAGAKHIRLVMGRCDECEHVSGLRMCEKVRDTANALLETWNSEVRVQISRKLPRAARLTDKGYDESKRLFFTDTKGTAKKAAVVAGNYAIDDALDIEEPEEPKYQKVDEEGALPHFVPNRRELLMQSLGELGEPQDVMIDTRLWGHVVIETDKCAACMMCATFCPTGALHKFQDEDGTVGIEHYPGDCVKCRTCEQICPKHALWISEEVFAVDMLSGAMERYVLGQSDVDMGSPQQMLHGMKKLMHDKYITEA